MTFQHKICMYVFICNSLALGIFHCVATWAVKGTCGQASQSPKGEQVPQVLIHLRSLKPSLPKGIGKNFQKVLPSMPKVAPMNLPNIGQFITKCEWDEAPPLPACRMLALPDASTYKL